MSSKLRTMLNLVSLENRTVPAALQMYAINDVATNFAIAESATKLEKREFKLSADTDSMVYLTKPIPPLSSKPQKPFATIRLDDTRAQLRCSLPQPIASANKPPVASPYELPADTRMAAVRPVATLVIFDYGTIS